MLSKRQELLKEKLGKFKKVLLVYDNKMGFQSFLKQLDIGFEVKNVSGQGEQLYEFITNMNSFPIKNYHAQISAQWESFKETVFKEILPNRFFYYLTKGFIQRIIDSGFKQSIFPEDDKIQVIDDIVTSVIYFKTIVDQLFTDLVKNNFVLSQKYKNRVYKLAKSMPQPQQNQYVHIEYSPEEVLNALPFFDEDASKQYNIQTQYANFLSDITYKCLNVLIPPERQKEVMFVYIRESIPSQLQRLKRRVYQAQNEQKEIDFIDTLLMSSTHYLTRLDQIALKETSNIIKNVGIDVKVIDIQDFLSNIQQSEHTDSNRYLTNFQYFEYVINQLIQYQIELEEKQKEKETQELELNQK